MKSCRYATCAVLLAALLAIAGEGYADTWHQTASATLSTEYDTNPLMSTGDAEGIWRYTLEPGYRLAGDFDSDEIRTGLALQFSRSSNAALNPNRNSPTAFLDWLHQTQTGEFGLNSRYAETTTRNVDIAITDPGLSDNTRSSRTLSGRWSNALSERSTLAADGAYETVFYSGGPYIDYASKSLNMIFSYMWSEENVPFLRLLHTEYEPANDTTPNSFSDTVIVGLNWKTSEALEGTLQIGRSALGNAEMGTQGGASVRYTTERNLLVFSADRQIAPSGLGGLATVDQLNGSWSHDLSERTRSGISLVWRKNRVVTDIISHTAGAWLQFELDTFWNLRTYYLHNMINAEGMDGAYSNIVGISIAYTHTDF